MTSPAIRHAATVIVLRPAGAGRPHEIYMVRRSAKSPFMPSTLVFPGGRLDPEDGDPEDDASWERAARRECQEETGLALDQHPLAWFDTWLTPSGEAPRRYLARFFLAQLEGGEGGEARADGVETHEGRWATAAEHLRAWEAEEVDLPPPTLCVLLRLRDMETQGRQSLLDVDPRDPVLPKYVPRDGQHLIFMPHDPEYAELPGEGLPVPDRVRVHPARFIRDGRRWRPC